MRACGMSVICARTPTKTLPHSFKSCSGFCFLLCWETTSDLIDTYTHLQEYISGPHLESFQSNRLSSHREDLAHLSFLPPPIFIFLKKKKILVLSYLRTRLFVRFQKNNLLWFLSYFFMYWFSAYKGTARITFPSSYFKVFFLQVLPFKITKPESFGLEGGPGSMTLFFLVWVASDISDTKGPDFRNAFHTGKSNTIGGHLIPTNLPFYMFGPLS